MSAHLDVGSGNDQGTDLVPPDSSSEPGQGISEVDTPEGGEIESSTEFDGLDSEDAVHKADLSSPDKLKKFRSSYWKEKEGRLSAEAERDRYRTETERLQTSAGKGVYIDVNTPLEDFDAPGILDKLAQEEPEYYDRLADSFTEAHFWPSLTEELTKLDGVQLDVNVEADAFKLNQLTDTWNIISRRMTGGKLDGHATYAILEAVLLNPDIEQIVLSRLNGTSPASTVSPPASPSYAQPLTEEQIAQQYRLDPTDPAHRSLITSLQRADQEARKRDGYYQQELARRDAQIRRLNEKVDGVTAETKKLSGTTAEEAARRAEQRVEEKLEEMLRADLDKTYADAIPKTEPELRNDILDLTRTRLEKDSIHANARTTAIKWLKQAATRTDRAAAQRDEQKAYDALAVAAVRREEIMDSAAKAILGRVKTRVGQQRQRRVEATQRREIRGGTSTSPQTDIKPAPAGDQEQAKARIRERWRQSKGQGQFR